jgi:hypothetical protein
MKPRRKSVVESPGDISSDEPNFAALIAEHDDLEARIIAAIDWAAEHDPSRLGILRPDGTRDGCQSAANIKSDFYRRGGDYGGTLRLVLQEREGRT